MPDDLLDKIQRKRVTVPPRDTSLTASSTNTNLNSLVTNQADEDNASTLDAYTSQETMAKRLNSETLSTADLDLVGVSLRLNRSTYNKLKELCQNSITINNSTLVEALVEVISKPEYQELLQQVTLEADQRGKVRSLLGERKKFQTRSIKLGLS